MWFDLFLFSQCDPEDIVEDINSGIDDSDLLSHLYSNGITLSDAKKFGMEVIKLLNRMVNMTVVGYIRKTKLRNGVQIANDIVTEIIKYYCSI